MKEKIEVFITYKWEKRSEEIVGEIEAKLNGIETIRVLRDKTIVGYGDNIDLFMEKLREGEMVVMVLSNQYLHSINCMYEMTGLFCDDSDKSKVFPVMIDTSIRDPKYYLDLCSYWEEELNKMEKLISGSNNKTAIVRPLLKEKDKIELIISCIPRLFVYCREFNIPDSETMQKSGYEGLVNKIAKRADKLQGESALKKDTDRLMCELSPLIEQKLIEYANKYKANCNKVELVGFRGQPQSAIVIDDTSAVLHAILHDLKEEIGDEQMTNIRYTSSKHRREYNSKTLSEALNKMKNE